uniref:Uncharacterized protein n=1 Tax=Psilocybe cubensis TaxID=181762 RepID=A0A8H7XS11_PSICU
MSTVLRIELNPSAAHLRDELSLAFGLALGDKKRPAPIFSQAHKVPRIARELADAVHQLEPTWVAEHVMVDQDATDLCFELRTAYFNLQKALRITQPSLPEMPQSREFEVVFGLCKTIQQLRCGATSESQAGEPNVPSPPVTTPAPVATPVPTTSTGNAIPPSESSDSASNTRNKEDEVTRRDLILFITQLIDGMQAMSVDGDPPSQIVVPPTVITSSTSGAAQLGAPAASSSKGQGGSKRSEAVMLDYEAAGVAAHEPSLHKARKYANKRARSEETDPSMSRSITSPVPGVNYLEVTQFGSSTEGLSIDRALYNLYKEKADQEFHLSHLRKQNELTLKEIAHYTRMKKGKAYLR